MQHPALLVRDKLLAGVDQEYNVSDLLRRELPLLYQKGIVRDGRERSCCPVAPTIFVLLIIWTKLEPFEPNALNDAVFFNVLMCIIFPQVIDMGVVIEVLSQLECIPITKEVLEARLRITRLVCCKQFWSTIEVSFACTDKSSREARERTP